MSSLFVLALAYYPSIINQSINHHKTTIQKQHAWPLSQIPLSLSLSLNPIVTNAVTWCRLFHCREALTAFNKNATTPTVTQTATMVLQTTPWRRRSNRWRSWWRKTWDPPCSTCRGKVSASCPFLSPPPSPKPRVTPETLSPTAMAPPPPEYPRSPCTPPLSATASSKTPPPFPSPERAVSLTFESNTTPNQTTWPPPPQPNREQPQQTKWRGFCKV